jgi:hypothetical protein
VTRDDIIRMAREVGLLFDNTLRAPTPRITQKQKDIERFAALVAAAEREACARMVEPVDESLADEIRARGEK